MKRLLLMLALLACGTTAHAQAYQCSIPAGPVPVPQVSPDGPARRTAITGYSLMLSWSPEYCRGRERNAEDRLQCSGTNGRFGLVLHGLWPEGRNGAWPQWCPTSRKPAAETIRRNLCVTPSARLMAHEWAKHGTCMVKTPEAYFRISRILWDSLTLPDLDRLSRREGLNAGMIREAFVIAFPALKPEMVGIDLNERGWLQEVTICYGKDFLPARCSSHQFGARDSAPAKIWRGL